MSNKLIEELKNKNKSLLKEINNLTNEYDKLREEKIDNNRTIDYYKSKDFSNEKDINTLMEDIHKLNKDNCRLRQNLQIFVNENKECAKHIQMMERDIDILNKKNLKLIEDKNNLSIELYNSNQYTKQLIDEVEQLKDGLNSLEMEFKRKNFEKIN